VYCILLETDLLPCSTLRFLSCFLKRLFVICIFVKKNPPLLLNKKESEKGRGEVMMLLYQQESDSLPCGDGWVVESAAAERP